MKYHFKFRRDENKKIAKERIEILTEQIKIRPEYTRRYLQIIHAISKKYRVPVAFKFCGKCFNFYRTRIIKGQRKQVCACKR